MEKNLRAFLSVVEYGSLKAAGDRIGLTQPIDYQTTTKP